MKTLLTVLTILIVFISCKKKENDVIQCENYSSIKDFFSKNNIPLQTYTVNGITGGNFITPQGTKVIIPSNAFVSQTGQPITGEVIIKFKDIYKKSDMLLANMSTTTAYGSQLKSGGEFFIKAISNNIAVDISAGKKITVIQPALLTGDIDSVNVMQPFIGLPLDSFPVKGNVWFVANPTQFSVLDSANNYVFSMYNFVSPVDSGSWCNSDNETYFNSYTQTSLILNSFDDVNTYNTNVYLIFKNLSSMVHVYRNYNNNFTYQYAPLGLECTLVAIGIYNGNLYSSFVPIIIGSNQTVNFSLSSTTTNEFISHLKTLN